MSANLLPPPPPLSADVFYEQPLSIPRLHVHLVAKLFGIYWYKMFDLVIEIML